MGKINNEVIMSTEGFDPDSQGKPFYRCMVCNTVVSEWDLEEHHGCKRCANPRIKPTELSILEKVWQIILHPKIWEWNK